MSNSATITPAGQARATVFPSRRRHRSRRAGPRWPRPALCALLTMTAITYLWDLGASGNANTYYAAAVQAGTRSWKALLFGSLDPANLITVDKPPAALWVMAMSGRLFGFSSWSMLVPQALMGIGSVALLYGAVRRWSGPAVGLTAAAVLAFTPSAVLIFRFNNPDALLVLLMVAAAYTTIRAVDVAATSAGTRWMCLTGVLLGFGFLTKMLQVMLVVPALAGVLLLVSEVGLRRRIGLLLAAGVAMLVSAGWYVALVELWPPTSRPYVGGSTGNSLLELALGYNGLGRIVGGSGNGGPPGTGGGPSGAGGFGGSTGLTRMFNADFGGNISWLLPAGLLVLLAGLWLTRRAPRSDRARAGLVLWGGWLLVTALVFSFMNGTIHPYYVVALAPGLAATVAIGTGQLWSRRASRSARTTLAAGVVGTSLWSAELLTRSAQFVPWLRWAVLGAGLIAGLALLIPQHRWGRARTMVMPSVVLLALVGGAGGASAYAIDTALTPHQGSIISAGPATRFGPGGAGGPAGRGSRTPGGLPSGGADPAVVELLRAAGTTWSAATVGAQDAAGLELSSGTAVMGIGGFTGSDEAPTLAQFRAWVARGAVRYFAAPVDRPGAPGGLGHRNGVGSQISTWVAAHFAATTVGDYTIYDLTPTSR